MQPLVKTSLFSIVPIVLAAVLPAQEHAEPNPAVQRVAKQAGTWTGEGVWRETPDAEPAPWTATMKVESILDGHFVREDMHISVGMPTPIAYTTIYGWDADKERLFSVSFSNMGNAPMLGQVHWTGPRTMVGTAAGVHQGDPVVGRGKWRVDGDAIDYSHSTVRGAGDWFLEIEGTFRKADEPATLEATGAFMSMPAPPAMGELSRLIGEWRLEGEMTLPTGETKIPVAGRESIRSIFGGHVLAGEAKSEPMPDGSVWQGLSWFGWDAEERRYRIFQCDNTGDSSMTPAWWQGDDALVAIDARVMMGEPVVMRTVLHFDDGGMTGFDSTMIPSTRPPVHSFHATYRRAGAK